MSDEEEGGGGGGGGGLIKTKLRAGRTHLHNI